MEVVLHRHMMGLLHRHLEVASVHHIQSEVEAQPYGAIVIVN